MKIKNNIIGFVTLIALLSVTSFFSLNLFFQQRVASDKLDIHSFPYRIENWEGRELEITEKEYDILETRNLILREYVNSSGERLSLFIVYSETNRRVFHPPEVCMMGGGIKIIDKKSEKINHGKYNFSVNKLYTQKNSYRGLSLYCYKAGALYTDNFYLQQAYFAINQLFAKHKGGATIRVSMPVREDEKATLTILKEFMVETAKIIDNLPNNLKEEIASSPSAPRNDGSNPVY